MALLAILTPILIGCVQPPTIETNTDGKGQSGEWTIAISNGIAMATIRAINQENVSLRVVCGTDRVEKLILTTRVEGADPITANQLNGMEIPLQFYFDNRPAINLTSSVIADTQKYAVLGHQVVSVTPPLLWALKNSSELEVVNINERYKFRLLGADTTIKEMKCLS